MGWNNVPICDEHWQEEEGDRQAIRVVEAARDNQGCYRCGRRTDGILVRRNTPDAAGTIEAACARCGKEVNSGQDETTMIVLGMTYDDVAVCMMMHRECYRAVDRVYVAPQMSDQIVSPAQRRMEELTGYSIEEYEPADRLEDA